MLESFEFDYANFYEKLLLASRQSFKLLKDRHANETFYCFAFVSHPDHGYVFAAASTEEGLTKVAKHYIDHYPERYGKVPLADMRTSLRHSIADSPVYEIDLIVPIFAEVNRIASIRSHALQEIWSELSDEYGEEKADQLVQPHEVQFLDTCFAILKQLDSEGVFAVGAAREHVVVLFDEGDQTDEVKLTYAFVVNPNNIAKRYGAEVQAGRKMDQQISQNR